MLRKNHLNGVSGEKNNELFGKRLMTMLSKSDSLMKAGDLGQSLVMLDGVLTLSPGMERALITKGLILSNQGKFQEAAGVFARAIDVNGNNVQSRLSRAFALTQIRQFEKSIEDYSYVVDSIGTDNGEVFYFRAIAYLNNKAKEKACIDLDMAISLGYKAAKQLKKQQCN